LNTAPTGGNPAKNRAGCEAGAERSQSYRRASIRVRLAQRTGKRNESD